MENKRATKRLSVDIYCDIHNRLKLLSLLKSVSIRFLVLEALDEYINSSNNKILVEESDLVVNK